MVGSDGMGCIYKASSSQGRRVEMVCLRKSRHWRGSCFLNNGLGYLKSGLLAINIRVEPKPPTKKTQVEFCF